MKTQSTIRNIITITLWVAIAAAMIMVLVAAINNNRQNICTAIKVEIDSKGRANTFLSKEDILKLIEKFYEQGIVGKAKASIPVDAIEEKLAKAQWVKSAELFFDKQNVLHVKIDEVTPVARVFTTSGKSYCLNSEKVVIPIAEHTVFNVPVFTNVPDKIEHRKTDSLFKEDVVTVSNFILADTLWSSLISQIVVTPSQYYKNRFEMLLIPIVGNQKINIGTSNDIEEKFGRLLLFYQNVLAKTGFEKYGNIDVRYRGQVIVSAKDKAAAAMVSKPLPSSTNNTKSVESKKSEIKKVSKQDKPVVKSKEVKKETNIKGTPIKKQIVKPKAVMPSVKKSGNN